ELRLPLVLQLVAVLQNLLHFLVRISVLGIQPLKYLVLVEENQSFDFSQMHLCLPLWRSVAPSAVCGGATIQISLVSLRLRPNGVKPAGNREWRELGRCRPEGDPVRRRGHS